MKLYSIITLSAFAFSRMIVIALPEEERNNLLERAEFNKSEIAIALNSVSPEQKKGMDFLVKYMPESDLKTIKSDFLLENVKLAYKARKKYQWTQDVPEEIFLNDVLPYAVVDETRDNWRKDFHERFDKYVKNAETLEEAVRLVNFAVQKEVNVKYSRKRKKPHQSPYESMEINVASCTGLSILLIDAFRSVGIPARMAGIPSWTTKEGNHNWVEVWMPSDKSWHCTEFNPDKSGVLDKGWYVKHASQANPESVYHSIYASSWKPTKIHFPLVWDLENKQVHGINVSDFYIALSDSEANENLCELRIDYTKDGERIAIPVIVTQSDVKIREGLTPMLTDDMNQFLTVLLKKGQMYQVKYQLPNETKWEVVKIGAEQTKVEEGFLRLKLDQKLAE